MIALWFLASKHRHQTAIAVDRFIELLELSFAIEIPPFNDEWRSLKFNKYSFEGNSFAAFEETIFKQIVDLREMDETGFLSNELRYFGLDSPRGNRWFNFDPLNYIECATAGFAVWEDNKLTKSDRNIPESSNLSWNQIKNFLLCGQIYE